MTREWRSGEVERSHLSRHHDGRRAAHDDEPVPAAGFPAQVLALQRLAGNRAVAQVLDRPSPTIQRLATRTGLKMEHAKKVLYNHLKGDPPFKPQRGNFGQVSWFAGSGNPYVGGQAQSYDVTVDATITPDPARLPATYFSAFKTAYVRRTGADLADQSTHHDFWVALGKALETGGAQEVPIDQSEVSRQGGGTFVVVGGSAREAITLTNPAKLAQDVGASAASQMKSVLAARAQNRAPQFAVRFVSIPQSLAVASPPVAKLRQLLAKPAQFAVAEKKFPGMGWGEKKVEPTVELVFTLTYPDYATARVQAKRLATAIGDGKLPGYGTIWIQGGTGWSANATKSYRL
jgi:hypothetical protein